MKAARSERAGKRKKKWEKTKRQAIALTYDEHLAFLQKMANESGNQHRKPAMFKELLSLEPRELNADRTDKILRKHAQ
jgi:hypothetical protein